MADFIKPGDFSQIREWMRVKHKYNFTPIPILFEQTRKAGAKKFETYERKKKIYRNLKTAFGKEYNTKALEEIARKHFEYLELLELTLLWPKIQDFAYSDRVNVEGLENLTHVLAAGKGAVLLTAHFGYARLIKHLIRLQKIEAWLVGPRVEEKEKNDRSTLTKLAFEKWLKMPTFSANHENDLESTLNVRPLLRKLQQNETLILTADGLRASNLIEVNVLGQKIPCASGSAALARGSGASILPTFVVDDPESEVGVKMVIEPPLDLAKTTDKKCDVKVNLQKFGDVFERYIREYPHMYRWAKSNFFAKRLENSKVDVTDRYAGNFRKTNKENVAETP